MSNLAKNQSAESNAKSFNNEKNNAEKNSTQNNNQNSSDNNPNASKADSDTTRPRILVLGAGYASLSLLKGLNRQTLKNAQITLISKEPYHYASVLLHEVASGYKDRQTCRDLQAVLPRGVEFVCDSVERILPHRVECARGAYEYDTLIIGLGFSSDTFGIAGVAEHAMSLIDYTQARAIFARLRENLEAYKRTNDERYLRVVVCGGGFSGSELVASIAIEFAKLARQSGVDASLLRLICIEALPNVLPMFAPHIAQKGRAYMESLGIEVRSSCRILACEDGAVVISCAPSASDASNSTESKQERIESKCIIWTAGVKGNEVMDKSFVCARSRVEVDEYLLPKNALVYKGAESGAGVDSGANLDSGAGADSGKINSGAKSGVACAKNSLIGRTYIIGDCASLIDPSTSRPYAPTAQLAQQEGEYLARVFNTIFANKSLGSTASAQTLESIAPFRYESKGTFCSLGNRFGIGIAKNREFSGLLALLIKRFIEWKWWRKLSK
ncbi:hypothetical protein BKN38_05145 [Helicobacter sp. CLO-3]|uniref:NAD(P)/FAD-dependent oxidoreductase n=1 Tax=unclassified Helicobacter TaxID=2593540 RepID=UPI000805B1DF|nr:MULTISPECIES: FAD-dependent oxidoreductase [unclassified Helicobacter]OBV29123.1 hypothetical protein BA723_06720 [Helicobacter sp. CLO-3]OHU83709.1 hypothetical protein BKN38_05145 [Helicobacter sp. CLO-3]